MMTNRFPERLRELRKEHGLTQKSLAAVIHKSAMAISHWEKGDSQPDFDLLLELCDYFEVSSDYLLGRTEY